MKYCLWCLEEMIRTVQWGNLFNLTKPHVLCTICSDQIEKIGGNRCPICSRPQTEKNRCFDCERWEGYFQNNDPLTTNYSLYTYNSFMQDIITKWKYRGDYCLREIFREDFNQAVQKFVKAEKIQAQIVPIPLSNDRTLERGFNQAGALAGLLDRPISDVMKRVHSEKQSKLRRYERMNTGNPFTVIPPIVGPVIIVDDIYTTGRTLRHAASLLKANGATDVYAFTLIRG